MDPDFNDNEAASQKTRTLWQRLSSPELGPSLLRTAGVFAVGAAGILLFETGIIPSYGFDPGMLRQPARAMLQNPWITTGIIAAISGFGPMMQRLHGWDTEEAELPPDTLKDKVIERTVQAIIHGPPGPSGP